MDSNIYSHLDPLLKQVRIDRSLLSKVTSFRMKYISSTAETVDFWTKPYIGTHRIYFTTAIVHDFIATIFNISPVELVRTFKGIPDSKDFKKSWKISGDPLNLSLFYLINKSLRSTKVSKKLGEAIAEELLKLFIIRSISALHSNSFEWLNTETVAIATYESLSRQFILKQTGSWIAFTEYRAAQVLRVTNRRKLLTTLHQSDKTYVSILNDVQSRPKSTFKIVYQRMLDIIDNNLEIAETSISESIDEKDGVAEVTDSIDTRIEETIKASPVPSNFISTDIVRIIVSILKSVGEKDLHDTLMGLSLKALKTKHIHIWYRQVLVYSYSRIEEEGYTHKDKKDIPMMLVFLKGMVGASRSVDEELLTIRKEGDRLIKPFANSNNKQIIVRVRTGIILYLYLLSRVL